MQSHNAGVIFVHGIQGSPRQFDFLIDTLPLGTPYKNLLLPGHGSDLRAFRRSGAAQWQAAVDSAAEELGSVCERLVFVGHSMGCLLGLNTAMRHPGMFSGMLELCCPFRIRPTLRYFKTNARALAAEREKETPEVRAAREANSVSTDHPAAMLLCAHPYFELLRLIRAARGLPRPEAGRLVFRFSERDEIVGRSSLRFARERFGAEASILDGCGHNYFNEGAKMETAALLAELISG